jgi:hypothetical protein
LIAALARHAGHLGGTIVRPRATLGVLRTSPPRFEVLIPWLFLATGAADPIRAGQSILLGRIAPIDGLLLFFQQVLQRFGGPVVGAFVVGGVLYWIDRRKRKAAYDVWSSIAAFTLVPHLLLVLVGGALAARGLDLWFLPHRALVGVGWVLGVKILVAFGWSIGIAALWIGLVFSEAPPAGSTT